MKEQEILIVEDCLMCPLSNIEYILNQPYWECKIDKAEAYSDNWEDVYSTCKLKQKDILITLKSK